MTYAYVPTTLHPLDDLNNWVMKRTTSGAMYLENGEFMCFFPGDVYHIYKGTEYIGDFRSFSGAIAAMKEIQK